MQQDVHKVLAEALVLTITTMQGGGMDADEIREWINSVTNHVVDDAFNPALTAHLTSRTH